MKTKIDCITQTALRLFTSQGIESTSTSQITKEAGVATGTLFYYFPTKDDLVDHLYVLCVDSFMQTEAGKVSTSLPVKEALYQNSRAYILWAMENQEKFHYIQQYANFVSGKDTVKFSVYEQAELLSVFEKGFRQGELKPIPTPLLIDLWSALVNGFAQHFIENPEKAKDEDYLHMMCSIAWDSIRKT